MGASLHDLLPEHDSAGSDELLRRFLEYVAGQGLVASFARDRCSSCCASASWSEPCSS